MRPRISAILISAMASAAILLAPGTGNGAGDKKKFSSSYVRIHNSVDLSDHVALHLEYYSKKDGTWSWHEKNMTLKPKQDVFLTHDEARVTASKVQGHYTYRELNGKHMKVEFLYHVNPGKQSSYESEKRHVFTIWLRDQIMESPGKH